jgi:hypothetical protein
MQNIAHMSTLRAIAVLSFHIARVPHFIVSTSKLQGKKKEYKVLGADSAAVWSAVV